MKKQIVLSSLAITLLLMAVPAAAQDKDIVDTAVAAGNFKTLAKLLTDADLVGQMKGPGPYTVFAPTDEAFAKVPKETLDALAKDKEKLRAVLTYHVLTSAWTSDDIRTVKSTGTANGKRVTFSTADGTLKVNDAKIVKADIVCANGRIFVIDTVLLPPQ